VSEQPHGMLPRWQYACGSCCCEQLQEHPRCARHCPCACLSCAPALRDAAGTRLRRPFTLGAAAVMQHCATLLQLQQRCLAAAALEGALSRRACWRDEHHMQAWPCETRCSMYGLMCPQSAGMAVFDTMRHVRPDVSTVCVGLAASMGAFLLAAGQQGKRYSLANSRIMIHQPLGGAQGQAADVEIQVRSLWSSCSCCAQAAHACMHALAAHGLRTHLCTRACREPRRACMSMRLLCTWPGLRTQPLSVQPAPVRTPRCFSARAHLHICTNAQPRMRKGRQCAAHACACGRRPAFHAETHVQVPCLCACAVPVCMCSAWVHVRCLCLCTSARHGV
jgi:hypothetical protein